MSELINKVQALIEVYGAARLDSAIAIADLGIADIPGIFDDVEEDCGDPGALPDLVPVAKKPVGTRPPPVSGTKPVLIRMPRRVTQAFKMEAARRSTTYQTLMKRTLQEAAGRFHV